MDFSKLKNFLETLDHKSLSKIEKIIKRIHESRQKQPKAFDDNEPPATLHDLLSSNWWWYFDKYDNDYAEAKHYVYFHADPLSHVVKLNKTLDLHRTQTPFYVGVGVGDRLLNFHGRSRFHTARIRELIEAGETMSSISVKLKDKITERQARILESKMIYYFGCIGSDMISVNSKSSKLALYGGKPCLLNQQYEPMPSGLLIKRRK